MERTKETLEARVRETPLVDRLKECRQRIGKMCSEGRPPRMCIPVQHDDDDFFISTTLSDAQATVEALQAQLEAAERHNTILQDANKVALEKVEALQAEKLMLERGVSAQSALIDGLQSQLIQRTAALEAVQHERDEANSHVKFLGATKQANGSFCLDMKKYHARYRCGRHRDDPWKGIDTEIDCFVCLKHDLDAEREKVKGLHEVTRVICTHCCEPMEIPSKAVLQTQLAQLQALVRALPVPEEGGFPIVEVDGDYYVNHTSRFSTKAEADAYTGLLIVSAPPWTPRRQQLLKPSDFVKISS